MSPRSILPIHLQRWGLLSVVLAAGCNASSPSPSLADLHFSATGYFHVESEPSGRHWLVDPVGKPFFSTGVSVIRAEGDFAPTLNRSPYHDNLIARYGDETAWAAETARRLHDWNVNTIGAWSDHDRFRAEFAYTPIVDCANADWQSGTIPDYFSAAFRSTAEAQATKATDGRASDPSVLGYFLDNELQWGEDPRNPKTLLEQYMALPATAEGKVALIALFKARYPSISAFNNAWGGTFASFDDLLAATTLPQPTDKTAADGDRSAFLSAAAHEYFDACTKSMRAHDPNHLFLGVRFFAVVTRPEVVAEAAKTQDVLSINLYEFKDFFYQVGRGFSKHALPGDQWVAPYEAMTDKPFLLSEWSYLAADSGLPNSDEGIYYEVDSEAEKADKIAAYARRAAETPSIVGYHYFQYFDQPKEGRFDGENNDFGLVKIDDSPWPLVTAALKSANGAAAEVHLGSSPATEK